MVHSRQDNSRSSNQEIHRLLRNSKVRYRVTNSLSGTYPKQDESSPHLPTLFPEDPF
jgi:hypothetical protein